MNPITVTLTPKSTLGQNALALVQADANQSRAITVLQLYEGEFTISFPAPAAATTTAAAAAPGAAAASAAGSTS